MDSRARNGLPNSPRFGFSPAGGKKSEDFGLLAGAKDSAGRIQFQFRIIDNGLAFPPADDHHCRPGFGRMFHGFPVQGFQDRNGQKSPFGRKLANGHSSEPLIVGFETQLGEDLRLFRALSYG